MITGNQRRRAVAELREASTGAYRHVDSLDVIAGAVGVEIDGKFGHEVENETYAALADFIDRPTCELRYDAVHNDWWCTRCGTWYEEPVVYIVDESAAPEPYEMRYCTACGAEFMKRGE